MMSLETVQENKQANAASLKRRIVATIFTDKKQYNMGDMVKFTLTFKDRDGIYLDPDPLKVYYNYKVVALERLENGVYTFDTPLEAMEHQLIVIAGNQRRSLSFNLKKVGKGKVPDLPHANFPKKKIDSTDIMLGKNPQSAKAMNEQLESTRLHSSKEASGMLHSKEASGMLESSPRRSISNEIRSEVSSPPIGGADMTASPARCSSPTAPLASTRPGPAAKTQGFVGSWLRHPLKKFSSLKRQLEKDTQLSKAMDKHPKLKKIKSKKEALKESKHINEKHRVHQYSPLELPRLTDFGGP